jgi:hypothetical protein
MSGFWRDGWIIAALRKAFSKDTLRRAVKWGQEKVPPGLRSLLGLVLIVGGFFGFLPILGFWMIPLGGALIALDIPPLRRRLLAWLDRDDDHAGKN